MEKKVVLVRCPLVESLDVKERKKPIYLSPANNEQYTCCGNVPLEETGMVLLIPFSWTLKKGTLWLKKDVQEFKKEFKKENPD